MAAARTTDNLSAIEQIISRSQKGHFGGSMVPRSIRLIEIAFILIVAGYFCYQAAVDASPMTQPQGVVLRALVEKAAGLHGELPARALAALRSDLGMRRDDTMTRRQWRAAICALAAQIDQL